MDRTSWKPKVFKATESVDYKVNEVNIERGGSSMKIDGKNVIKIWESFSGWYWYAIEDQGSYTGIGADGNEVQAHAWYGYVQGMENEWGTWDSNELERAGVWTVPKSNWGWTGKESKASENWKDIANKFYKEELNKGKKSGGESKANELDLENYKINPWGDIWSSECKKCGAEFDEYSYQDSENSVREHLMSEHGIDDSHLGNTLYSTQRNYQEEGLMENWAGGGAEKEIGKWIKSGDYMGKPDYRNYNNEEWEMVNQEHDATDSMNSSIGSSNREADYYPSRDIINNDVSAKSKGQSWQKGGEAYFVEWGYDLDYDFEEVDDIDEAKQLAKDNGGNVYLDDKLVYSVIPSIKKDPTNDKSKFIVSNNLMGVESKASEGIRNSYDMHEWWKNADLNQKADVLALAGVDRSWANIDDLNDLDGNVFYRIQNQMMSDQGTSTDFLDGIGVNGEPEFFDGTRNGLPNNTTPEENPDMFSYPYDENLWNKESKASEGMKDKNGNMICHFCGSIDTVLNILEREIWEGWEKYEWWCCKDCGNCFKGDIVSTDKGSYEESKANEGFYQGLYGHVDAKCKTCGVEFDSISDMDDHYAMNSDHISNLDDLDNDIPNSD